MRKSSGNILVNRIKYLPIEKGTDVSLEVKESHLKSPYYWSKWRKAFLIEEFRLEFETISVIIYTMPRAMKSNKKIINQQTCGFFNMFMPVVDKRDKTKQKTCQFENLSRNF